MQQLGVAEAHARATPQRAVAHDERQPHDAEAERRAEQRVREVEAAQRGRRHAEHRAADGHAVGQVHVLEVDERRRDEAHGEGEIRGVQRERRAEGVPAG